MTAAELRKPAEMASAVSGGTAIWPFPHLPRCSHVATTDGVRWRLSNGHFPGGCAPPRDAALCSPGGDWPIVALCHGRHGAIRGAGVSGSLVVRRGIGDGCRALPWGLEFGRLSTKGRGCSGQRAGATWRYLPWRAISLRWADDPAGGVSRTQVNERRNTRNESTLVRCPRLADHRASRASSQQKRRFSPERHGHKS
jgi:hypothetical protein